MQDRDIQTLTLSDPGYPRRLREIHTPPPMLYVKGTLLAEDEAAVAIVGTRSATLYGRSQATRFGEELAKCGITVVSGLAEGIDAAAHEGALRAGGRTIAVVGHGFSTLYPAHHRELAERITKSGCLISEFPMEEKPSPWNFPKRNRIISGLSLGVLVVEAPEKSGALITAKHAMEQGREVFAVPGPVTSFQSRGTHELLKDGATLVCDVQDILEELAPQLKACLKAGHFEAEGRAIRLPKAVVSSEARDPARSLAPQPALSEAEGGLEMTHRAGLEMTVEELTYEEGQVLEAVPVGDAASVDALARETALAPARLLSVLTGLELKGRVQQTLGRGYTRAR